MKKETAWKIFKFFSVLLIVDFVLLPPLSALIDRTPNVCYDYNFLSCMALFLFLPLIVGFVWIVFWWKTYAVAFMDEKQAERWCKKFPIIAHILIVFGRGFHKIE